MGMGCSLFEGAVDTAEGAIESESSDFSPKAVVSFIPMPAKAKIPPPRLIGPSQNIQAMPAFRPPIGLTSQ